MAKKTQKQSQENLFQGFKKNLDQFLCELEDTNGRLQRIFRERFDELKEVGGAWKRELKHKERWDEADVALRRAGQELAKAANAVFGKAKKKPVKTTRKTTRKTSPVRKKTTTKTRKSAAKTKK